MSKAICMICGRELDRVANHLASHNITKKEYLEKFPDAKMMSDEFSERLSNKTKNQWKSQEFREAVTSAVKLSNAKNRDKLVARMKELNKRQKDDPEFREYCSSRRSEGQSNSWKKDWVRESRVKGMKASFLKDGYTNKQWDKIRGIGGQMYHQGEINGVRYRSSYEKYFLEFLFSNNIEFMYEHKYFEYTDLDGKVRKYYPDYYLVKYDLYIEIHPVNLLSERFINKIKSVPNLLLLTEKELFSDNLLGIITKEIGDQHPSS